WQCGLIPAYLKSTYKDDPFFKNTRTVFTVYSLGSHGTFPKTSHEKTGIPMGSLNLNGHNGNDKLNFLTTGVTFADLVTTMGHKADKGLRVSPQDEMGKILHDRKNFVVPMSNGSAGHTVLAEKFVNLYRELTKNG